MIYLALPINIKQQYTSNDTKPISKITISSTNDKIELKTNLKDTSKVSIEPRLGSRCKKSKALRASEITQWRHTNTKNVGVGSLGCK